MKGSPADPNRIYASQSSSWFGQVIQRSDDGGKTLGAGRQRVRLRRRARHAPVVRRHAAPVGVQARLAPRAVAAPIRTRCYAGVEDAALFRTTDGGKTLAGAAGPARATARARTGSPAPAACACTRSCSTRPNPARIFIAISAAGAFRTDDGGKTLAADQPRPRTPSRSPTRPPRSATACTASRCTRRAPTCSSCRSTGT